MWWIRLLPRNLISRLFGRLARIRWPAPFRMLFLMWFARRYRLNMGEAELPLHQYATLQDLFTRRLKPGVRPLADAAVVHPADGELTMGGKIVDGQLIQAKGWTYRLAEFLGESDAEVQAEFGGGTFLTYYLCPTDYHRVHAPIAGAIYKARYIRGDLWPVNAWSVTHIRRLFNLNERVVVWLRTAYGPVAVVLVGATNVGQISLPFDTSIVANSGQDATVRVYNPEVVLNKGDELGIFNMGSTVVVIYPARLPVAVGALPRPTRMGAEL